MFCFFYTSFGYYGLYFLVILYLLCRDRRPTQSVERIKYVGIWRVEVDPYYRIWLMGESSAADPGTQKKEGKILCAKALEVSEVIWPVRFQPIFPQRKRKA